VGSQNTMNKRLGLYQTIISVLQKGPTQGEKDNFEFISHNLEQRILRGYGKEGRDKPMEKLGMRKINMKREKT
jgi:hypothetical protein